MLFYVVVILQGSLVFVYTEINDNGKYIMQARNSGLGRTVDVCEYNLFLGSTDYCIQ